MKKKEELNIIISKCLRENRKAQEDLFKLFYGKMLGVSMRYTKDEDTAQEVVQESFIKCFDKLSTFDTDGYFEGWLKRIVINTAIDNIRKSKKSPYVNDLNEDYSLSNEEEDDEDFEITKMKTDLIMNAIQNLSPAYQAVFNLYVVEEYTHREIADMLKISEGTSKSNLSKAKANLKKMLKTELLNLDI